MSYSLNVVEHPQYLHMRVTGENSLSGPSLDLLDIFAIVEEASSNVQGAVMPMAYVDTLPGIDRIDEICRDHSDQVRRRCSGVSRYPGCCGLA
jgi:hypothetical protein